jgi:transcriptional regulator with XRE-family HTH domain
MCVSSAELPQFEQRHRLQRALEHAGIGPQDMADELGVHRNTVGRYLHGRSRPRRRDLVIWAQRCQVPYDWLVSGDRQLPPNVQALPRKRAAQVSVADNKAYVGKRRSLPSDGDNTHSYPRMAA